ncbi:OLC1v1018738C1 [Oldenlandia corymbosa var. corymbosa]|uniref:OLC1v1018738C1 n=1 Tax=Oldenlandia corymbosa var. corymbosa TaxID=529605 RepID=A0AAV1ECF0_OLDCO|nr:OLC1v1018738C1 [Oldenlandia corymbosa var. corymbosa]
MANRIGLGEKLKFYYVTEENEVELISDDWDLEPARGHALAEDRWLELYALEVEVEGKDGEAAGKASAKANKGDDFDNDANEWSDKDSEYNSEFDDQDYAENVGESEATWGVEDSNIEAAATVAQGIGKMKLVGSSSRNQQEGSSKIPEISKSMGELTHTGAGDVDESEDERIGGRLRDLNLTIPDSDDDFESLHELDEEDGTIRVNKFVPKHICSWVKYNPCLISSWIALRAAELIKEQPTIKPRDFKKTVKERYNIDMTRDQAYKARKKAIKAVLGNQDDQFKKLRGFWHELLRIYKRCYEPFIYPLREETDWEWDKVVEPPILPPIRQKVKGRPTTKRRRSTAEILVNQENKEYKLSKKGQRNHCSKCDRRGHNVRSCKDPPRNDLGQTSENYPQENLSTEVHDLGQTSGNRRQKNFWKCKITHIVPVSDGLCNTEVQYDADLSLQTLNLDSIIDLDVELWQDTAEVEINKHAAPESADNVGKQKLDHDVAVLQYTDELIRPMTHMGSNPPKRSDKATRGEVPVIIIPEKQARRNVVHTNPTQKTKKRKVKATSSSQAEKRVRRSVKEPTQRKSSSQAAIKLVDENIDEDPTTDKVQTKKSFRETFGLPNAPSPVHNPLECKNDKEFAANAIAQFKKLQANVHKLLGDVPHVKSSKALYDLYQGPQCFDGKGKRFEGNFSTKSIQK